MGVVIPERLGQNCERVLRATLESDFGKRLWKASLESDFGELEHSKLLVSWVKARAYRAAVGGERACNVHSTRVDIEILLVTKNSANVQIMNKT